MDTTLVESFKGRPSRRDRSGTRGRNKELFASRAWSYLVATFVPEGRVTPDYYRYQAWDSLQGLCSYIRGMLSSQAILVGMGVGQSSATAQTAVFSLFLRDMSGTLGGILFAAVKGSGLDAYAKQWRFFADCMNNVGYFLDIISPIFPAAFLPLACLGSLAKAITGVAAGATRSALTQHFALDGNAAEVSAKEGSQESLVTLMGMLLGMVTVNLTAGSIAGVWGVFLLLTALHVFANYQAMRSLELTTLNTPRLIIIARHMRRYNNIPTAKRVAQEESLKPPLASPSGASTLEPGVTIRLGSRLAELDSAKQQKLLSTPSQIPFSCFLRTSGRKCHVDIMLKSSCTEKQKLHAFLHAAYLSQPKLQAGLTADEFANIMLKKLSAKGWNVDQPYLDSSNWRVDWSQSTHEE